MTPLEVVDARSVELTGRVRSGWAAAPPAVAAEPEAAAAAAAGPDGSAPSEHPTTSPTKSPPMAHRAARPARGLLVIAAFLQEPLELGGEVVAAG